MARLVTKFGTYKLGKYTKATGRGVMDLLDIGNFDLTRIADIIKLGNPNMNSDEEAYAKLDEYLEDSEDNSIITAFFDLIEALDRDLKILKSCGLKVEDIKSQFTNEIENRITNKEEVKPLKDIETIEAETSEN